MIASSFFKSNIAALSPNDPVKFHKNGDTKTLGEIINDEIPELAQGASFYVNPLLSSGHAQTAYTALNKFEKIDLIHYKRCILTVDSHLKFYYVKGDKMPYDRWKGTSTFAVDYVVPKEASDPGHQKFCPESQVRPLPPRTEYLDPAKEQALLDNDKPLIIGLHGLSGGLFESYLRAFLAKATEPPFNFDALVLNSRGCAHHTITSPQLFCGLWTNDLRYLINEHIRKKWPNKKIVLIGFSLGGGIVANYLGQEGSEVYRNIKGAAIMGSPWDFAQSSTALVDTFLGSKVYSPTMCQNLLKLIEEHHSGYLKSDAVVADYKKNPEKFQLKNLRDFDDVFTSRLFGFNCAQEYYRHASPDQRLLNVRVPIFIFSSVDDPIVGSKSLPFSEVRLNPYAHMVTTSVGGHLGWFDYSHNRWYPEPVLKLFQALTSWEVEDLPEEKLPKPTDGNWKHDRIIL